MFPLCRQIPEEIQMSFLILLSYRGENKEAEEKEDSYRESLEEFGINRHI